MAGSNSMRVKSQETEN